MPARRHNWRNEALRLREMLISTVRVVEVYWPEQMPDRVQKWWQARKNERVRERIRASEEGVAAREIHGMVEERVMGWDE